MKPWEPFEDVDNKDGRFKCHDCGEALISVRWYRHPKDDRKMEMRGRCINKKCELYEQTQTIGPGRTSPPLT
jgi:hypothetical protein